MQNVHLFPQNSGEQALNTGVNLSEWLTPLFPVWEGYSRSCGSPLSLRGFTGVLVRFEQKRRYSRVEKVRTLRKQAHNPHVNGHNWQKRAETSHSRITGDIPSFTPFGKNVPLPRLFP